MLRFWHHAYIDRRRANSVAVLLPYWSWYSTTCTQPNDMLAWLKFAFWALRGRRTCTQSGGSEHVTLTFNLHSEPQSYVRPGWRREVLTSNCFAFGRGALGDCLCMAPSCVCALAGVCRLSEVRLLCCGCLWLPPHFLPFGGAAEFFCSVGCSPPHHIAFKGAMCFFECRMV